MAREETTADDLEKLAQKLSSVTSAVDAMINQMRENNAPSVRLHLAMLTKRLLPQLEHWVDIAQLHTRDDIRAYLLGIESPSVAQRRYNEKRAVSAAKKPQSIGKSPPKKKKQNK